MARSGKKVMQFVEGGRYVAVVVDGKFIPYKTTRKGNRVETSEQDDMPQMEGDE